MRGRGAREFQTDRSWRSGTARTSQRTARADANFTALARLAMLDGSGARDLLFYLPGRGTNGVHALPRCRRQVVQH